MTGNQLNHAVKNTVKESGIFALIDFEIDYRLHDYLSWT